MVVLSVLDVISADDLYLAYVDILLPLWGGVRGWSRAGVCTYGEKVDLFEEFLFVVFELADHGFVWQGRARGRGCGSVDVSKFESAVDVLVQSLDRSFSAKNITNIISGFYFPIYHLIPS